MTIKVDLLDRPGRKVGFDPIIFFLALVIIIFVVGFYVFSTHLEQQVQDRKKTIQEVEEKIRSLEDKVPEINKLIKDNDDLQAQINTIKQLVYDPIRYANLLDEIAFIMPENIFISNLNIEPSTQALSFSGMSVMTDDSNQPLDSISKFMMSINNSKCFKDATLTSTTKQTYEGFDAFGFSIDTHYDPDNAVK